MAPVHHRFVALAAAAAVFMAHLACACHVSRAGTSLASDARAEQHGASRAAHACCKHESPASRQPAPAQQQDGHKGHCQHCNGLNAPLFMANTQVSVSSSPVVEPVFLASLPTGSGLAGDRPAVPGISPCGAGLFHPPTLLCLHCALNL